MRMRPLICVQNANLLPVYRVLNLLQNLEVSLRTVAPQNLLINIAVTIVMMMHQIFVLTNLYPCALIQRMHVEAEMKTMFAGSIDRLVVMKMM